MHMPAAVGLPVVSESTEFGWRGWGRGVSSGWLIPLFCSSAARFVCRCSDELLAAAFFLLSRRAVLVVRI